MLDFLDTWSIMFPLALMFLCLGLFEDPLFRVIRRLSEATQILVITMAFVAMVAVSMVMGHWVAVHHPLIAVYHHFFG